MKNIFKRIHFLLGLLGFNSLKFLFFFRGIVFYLKDFYSLKRQMKANNDFRFGKLYPVLEDKYSASGTMKGHYFHQDLLIAKRIFSDNPVKHVDIGSRIDGFVAHIAVFREIEVFDIRPQENTVKNIIFKQAELMKLPD